jgi:hypothetical protein
MSSSNLPVNGAELKTISCLYKWTVFNNFIIMIIVIFESIVEQAKALLMITPLLHIISYQIIFIVIYYSKDFFLTVLTNYVETTSRHSFLKLGFYDNFSK